MSAVLHDDGAIQYTLMTRETLEGSLEVMRKSFFHEENLCIALELQKYPTAIKELEDFCVMMAKDGVSIAAIDKATKQVVGAVFNKLLTKTSPGEQHCFEKFAAECEELATKILILFMENAIDLYDLYEVDCVMEILFLSTLSEHRGKGIGKKLFEWSLDVGRTLLTGKNIKQSVDGETLGLEPVPKVASSVFSSQISQKIGRSLGFRMASEVDYDSCSFNGKTYAERIGPATKSAVLGYVVLDDKLK